MSTTDAFYLKRAFDLKQVLERKSCFLLGPRQTGKSSYIRHELRVSTVFNLLDTELFRRLSRDPAYLRRQLTEESGLVVIDEIQLLPSLLNEVHLAIEELGLSFLLTGSSARKLRRSEVNLLGGRASKFRIFPLISEELEDRFELETVLSVGTLPNIYLNKSPWAELADYVELYLREEIAAETAIRQLPMFSRFLDVAALCSSQVVNYAAVASDAQLSPSTVREYFQVLEDTLLIHRLPVWRESKKRKATAKDKFYLFDVGVARFLQGRGENVGIGDDYGVALETYIHTELAAFCEYRKDGPLRYWRSIGGDEVDFLLGDHTAIEVKATKRVVRRHIKGLLALKEEGVHRNFILVCNEPRAFSIDSVRVLPVEEFLKKLWGGEFR